MAPNSDLGLYGHREPLDMRCLAERSLSACLPGIYYDVRGPEPSRSHEKAFDHEAERNSFVRTAFVVLSGGGKYNIDEHRFELFYSRCRDMWRAQLVSLKGGAIQCSIAGTKPERTQFKAFLRLKDSIYHSFETLLHDHSQLSAQKRRRQGQRSAVIRALPTTAVSRPAPQKFAVSRSEALRRYASTPELRQPVEEKKAHEAKITNADYGELYGSKEPGLQDYWASHGRRVPGAGPDTAIAHWARSRTMYNYISERQQQDKETNHLQRMQVTDDSGYGLFTALQRRETVAAQRSHVPKPLVRKEKPEHTTKQAPVSQPHHSERSSESVSIPSEPKPNSRYGSKPDLRQRDSGYNTRPHTPQRHSRHNSRPETPHRPADEPSPAPRKRRSVRFQKKPDGDPSQRFKMNGANPDARPDLTSRGRDFINTESPVFRPMNYHSSSSRPSSIDLRDRYRDDQASNVSPTARVSSKAASSIELRRRYQDDRASTTSRIATGSQSTVTRVIVLEASTSQAGSVSNNNNDEAAPSSGRCKFIMEDPTTINNNQNPQRSKTIIPVPDTRYPYNTLRHGSRQPSHQPEYAVHHDPVLSGDWLIDGAYLDPRDGHQRPYRYPQDPPVFKDPWNTQAHRKCRPPPPPPPTPVDREEAEMERRRYAVIRGTGRAKWGSA